MQEIQSLLGGFAVALSWFNVLLMLAGVSIGVMVVFFLMFEVWFKVPLPKGPIEAMIGFR